MKKTKNLIFGILLVLPLATVIAIYIFKNWGTSEAMAECIILAFFIMAAVGIGKLLSYFLDD